MKLSHFIDGKEQSWPQERILNKYAPIDGQLLYQLPEANETAINQAVASAMAAQKIWQQKSTLARSSVLRQVGRLLREQVAVVAELEVLDTGRPVSEIAGYDVISAAECFEYYASFLETYGSRYHELTGGSYFYTRYEPLGICAGIGAWNFPLQIAAWKAAPCLAAGNAMIFKPSELTARGALFLAQIMIQAGLPAGGFNVVLGGQSTGSLLVRHPQIAKISLTGSTRTGKAIMAEASTSLKKVSFELGGKSAILVMADCDLPQALEGVIAGNFAGNGEICSNGTRVFVQEGIYSQFCKALQERTARIKIGNPLLSSTEMGPLISQEQRQHVLGFIRSGIDAGAKLLCGSSELQAGPGYFLAPTIFADCRDDMEIVQAEIFGPVMALLPFATLPEAIERANSSPYGLAAGIFTQNLGQAKLAAHELKAGMVWINHYNFTPVSMPFGGIKQSGLGRENGYEGFYAYSEVKSVFVA